MIPTSGPLIKIIVVMAKNRAIGRDGKIPWHCPEDLRTFKRLTVGHDVIVGRATWEHLPLLPGRRLIVLTSRGGKELESVPTVFAESIEDALKAVLGATVWVAGGEKVYAQFIPLATEMYVTFIHNISVEDADAFFPRFDPDEWRCLEADRHNTHSQIHMVRKNKVNDLLYP